MEFWKNRFVIPGWMLVAAFVLLSRSLTVSADKTLVGTLVENSALGAILLGLAGAPLLGFLVDCLWEAYFRRAGVNGHFVHFKAFRAGLLEIIETLPEERRSRLVKTRALLQDAAYPDRAVYALAWWPHAASEYHAGCHRRWEVYHVTRGVILALALAVISTLTWAAAAGRGCEYFAANWVVLAVMAPLVAVLYVVGTHMATEAGQHENAWIARYLDLARAEPRLIETLALAELDWSTRPSERQP